MTPTLNKRLENAEKSTETNEIRVSIDWGDGYVVLPDGEKITQEEYDRRYPDAIHIDYDEGVE